MKRLHTSGMAWVARRSVAFVLGACAFGAAPATSQATPDGPPWTVSRVERVGLPVSALAVTWPLGSSSDPRAGEGSTAVFFDAVVLELEAELGLGAIQPTVEVTPEQVTLSALVRVGLESAALRVIERQVTGSGPSADAVDRARRSRLGRLLFERDSPVNEVRAAERALLYGADDPRARSPEGTVASVEALEPGALDRWRRGVFGAAAAAVVLVVPAPQRTPGAALSAPEGATPQTPAAAPPTPEGTTPPTPAAAPDSAIVARESEPMMAVVPATPSPELWSLGERSAVVREVTSHWVTVYWPIPDTADAGGVEALVHELRATLNAQPPEPGVFETQVDRIPWAGGEVLRVRRVVMPELADRAETRVLSAVERLKTPLEPMAFGMLRRRFLSARLLETAPPEVEARERSQRLVARGVAPGFPFVAGPLTANGLADVARSLGPPRVLSFGPRPVP